MEPNNLPDWDTPLDQTTPETPPKDTDSLTAALATGCALLFGLIVILLVVAAMVS